LAQLNLYLVYSKDRYEPN